METKTTIVNLYGKIETPNNKYQFWIQGDEFGDSPYRNYIALRSENVDINYYPKISSTNIVTLFDVVEQFLKTKSRELLKLYGFSFQTSENGCAIVNQHSQGLSICFHNITNNNESQILDHIKLFKKLMHEYKMD